MGQGWLLASCPCFGSSFQFSYLCNTQACTRTMQNTAACLCSTMTDVHYAVLLPLYLAVPVPTHTLFMIVSNAHKLVEPSPLYHKRHTHAPLGWRLGKARPLLISCGLAPQTGSFFYSNLFPRLFCFFLFFSFFCLFLTTSASKNCKSRPRKAGREQQHRESGLAARYAKPLGIPKQTIRCADLSIFLSDCCSEHLSPLYDLTRAGQLFVNARLSRPLVPKGLSDPFRAQPFFNILLNSFCYCSRDRLIVDLLACFTSVTCVFPEQHPPRPERY